MSILNTPLRVWLRGLVAAAVNSAASSITVLIVDPNDFNPFGEGSVSKLAAVVIVGAIFGAALYLKEHPLPEDETVSLVGR